MKKYIINIIIVGLFILLYNNKTYAKEKYIGTWQWIDNNLKYIDNQENIILDLSCDVNLSAKEKVLYWANILYDSNLCSYTNDIKYRHEGLTFDCSSFVGRLYRWAGIDFFTKNPTCSSQAKYFIENNKIIDYTELELGDIVYYGQSFEKITHCSLIIGNNPKKGPIVLSAFNKELGLYEQQLNLNNVLFIARP